MSLSGRIRTSLVTALVTGVGALFAAGCGLLSTAPPAAASSNMQSILEVPALEQPNDPDPTDTLQTIRWLGADMIRLDVTWNQFAPQPLSSTKPAGFNASDPNQYNWGWLDTVVNDAHRFGLNVDLLITGSGPVWAMGSNPPACTNNMLGLECYNGVFEPSPTEYGQFVHAVVSHFGSRVHFWELWNEANWGPALAPQYDNSSVPVSAKFYRGLVNAGYNALKSAGHGHDAISIANLSQDGSSPPVGETNTSAPLIFMRTLYCLNGSYRPLSGSAARQAACPTSKSGSRQFRSANPGLFQTSGVGDHPYPYGLPPSKADFPNPNGAEFSEIPQVLRALDKMQRAYGSSRKMVVYNTEYGYRTRPNDTQTFFTNPDNAAQYINQAEYISWKNPRVSTYDQFELDDVAGFPTGLFFLPNTQACSLPIPCPKPSFYAYRLPIWLPFTSGKRGRALEVWGDARPARFARSDTGQAQSVQIQFAPGGSSSYSTIKSVRVTNGYGYFDTQVKFPGSGNVRLEWSYPSGDAGLANPLAAVAGEPAALLSNQIYSRVTAISLH